MSKQIDMDKIFEELNAWSEEVRKLGPAKAARDKNEYLLKDPLHPRGGVVVKAPCKECCLFCRHCEDIFWDYMNGPYLFICNEDRNTHDLPCIYFEEDE